MIEKYKTDGSIPSWAMHRFLPLVLAFFFAHGHAIADTPANRQKLQANRKPSPRNELDPRQESMVLAMVDQHLPELKVLLEPLKKNQTRQYQTAIRNLAKSARRLQAVQKRGDIAYEREVAVIKAQTTINLLIAKLKVRDDRQDRDALRAAAVRLHHAELERARHDVSLMKSRLMKLQSQYDQSTQRLKENESKIDDRIDKSFQSYLRKSGRQ